MPATLQAFLNQIYQYIKATFPQINITAGTVDAQFVNTVGMELYTLQAQFQTALSNAFLSTAQGTFLDALGNDHGLTRTGPQTATGTVQFTRATSTNNLIVPQGTVVSTNNIDPASNILFTTTQQVSFTPGVLTTTAPVMATTPGAAGNVNLGTITLLVSPVAGVTAVINNAATTGGVNAESDDAFRYRIYANLQPQNTIQKVAAAALAVSGITSTTAFDQQDQKGSIFVYACQADGTLPVNLSNIVLTAVNGSKSVGTTPTIYAPTSTVLNIVYDYAVASGFAAASVTAAIQAIIEAYFAGLTIGDTFRPYDLLQMIIGNAVGFTAVPGLLNCQIVTPSGVMVPKPWEIYTLGVISAINIGN